MWKTAGVKNKAKAKEHEGLLFFVFFKSGIGEAGDVGGRPRPRLHKDTQRKGATREHGRE